MFIRNYAIKSLDPSDIKNWLVSYGEEDELPDDALSRYSSSVEELDKAGVERRKENKDKSYSEATLGENFVSDYSGAADSYDASKERQKEIDEHNAKARQAREEFEKEHGMTPEEYEEMLERQLEEIREYNEEAKRHNAELDAKNQKHAARGEPPEDEEYWPIKDEVPYNDPIPDEEKAAMEIWDSEGGWSALDIFPEAKSREDAAMQELVKNVVFDGEKVGAWVDFWEAIDKRLPDIMKALDTVKRGLLAAVDALEMLIDSLKQLVDILSAIVGAAIQMASLAVLLAKAVIASIKAILKQIMELLQFAILKSELKITTFNLFDKVITQTQGSRLRLPSNIDKMSPYVKSTFDEMTTQWFNRPTAGNELCFAMLIPCALSRTTAEYHGKVSRLIDLFSLASVDDLKQSRLLSSNSSVIYPKYTGGELRSVISQMKTDFGWTPDIASKGGDRLKSLKSACSVCNTALTQVTVKPSDLAEKLKGAYDKLKKEEETYVRNGSASFPENRLPGVLHQLAVREEEDSKAKVELNFANNRSHYIASVYRIKPGGDQKKLFFDPSFIFAQAVTISGVRTYLNDAIALFNVAVEWWYTRKSSTPAVSERETKQKLDEFFRDLLGDDTFQTYCNRYPFMLAAKDTLFTQMLQTVLKQNAWTFDTEITTYNGQKQKYLFYQPRSAVTPSVPRVRPTIYLENVDAKEGDTLVFILASDQGKYYPHSFIKKGGDKRAMYYAGFLAGDLSANLDIKQVRTLVLKKGAEMLHPRWYGIGTPPNVDDWTLSWVLQQAGIKDYIQAPLQTLTAIEGYLDVGSEYLDAFKEMFECWVGVFNRYYWAIKDVVQALRKMLLAFGLPNLPSVYVVTWQGGIQDLSSILMSALQDIGIDNSTYAGVVLFGSTAVPQTALFKELYETHNLTKAEIDKIKTEARQWWAEENELADEIELQGSSISKLDPLGLKAYEAKQKAKAQEVIDRITDLLEEKIAEEDAKVKARNEMLRKVKTLELEDGVFLMSMSKTGAVAMRLSNTESDIPRDIPEQEIAEKMEEKYGAADSQTVL